MRSYVQQVDGVSGAAAMSISMTPRLRCVLGGLEGSRPRPPWRMIWSMVSSSPSCRRRPHRWATRGSLFRNNWWVETTKALTFGVEKRLRADLVTWSVLAFHALEEGAAETGR